METFEFVVTSIARVALKEHVKIQAEGVEDAITRIEDNDYYEEDGEILSREYELIDYESTEDIMDWEDTAEVRKATEQWLENNWLHPDILLMRPAKSFTAGPICKKKLYEDNIKGKFYIPFVLEDNCKCVEMWRNEGLICLQPNEGKF